MNMTLITRIILPAVCVVSGAAVAISGSDTYGWFLIAAVFFSGQAPSQEG